MHVVKRDGNKENVSFDKITARIKKLCYGFDPKHVEPVLVAQKVVTGVYDGVSTAQLDDLASETAAFLTTQHPDYGKLAARIAVSNLHKETNKNFTETMMRMYGLPPHPPRAPRFQPFPPLSPPSPPLAIAPACSRPAGTITLMSAHRRPRP